MMADVISIRCSCVELSLNANALTLIVLVPYDIMQFLSWGHNLYSLEYGLRTPLERQRGTVSSVDCLKVNLQMNRFISIWIISIASESI